MTIGGVDEIVVVGIPCGFRQVILEIVKPVSALIAGAIRRFDADFFIGIIEETKVRNLPVGWNREIGILDCTEYRTLREG